MAGFRQQEDSLGRLLPAMGLLSAAALAYEILLTRLFALIQWHHFAYMMISVAMLGYGAAGTLVALYRDALLRRFESAFAAAASLFGVAAVGCFLLAQAIPFNPLEAFWDGRQFLRLALIYLCLFIPFLFAATALCLAFSRYGDEAPRLYSADILGAALGSLGVLGLLFLVPPMRALAMTGGLGLLAAAVVLRPSGGRRVALVLAALLLAALPQAWLGLRPSPYKDLSQAMKIVGARVLAEVSSPLGVLTVVENHQVPLRQAPGLSLTATQEPPPQLAVFSDGDGPGAITRFDGRTAPLAYLDYLTSALPYHLLQRPRVLVLGAGSGQDVLQALFHSARAVDAVELNPRMLELVQGRFAAFSGRPYSQPGVRAHLGEARGFVAGGSAHYDLIQLSLVDAWGASSAGLHALSESYLYTVEALRDDMRRLAPGGMLAITRWIALPPRDLLKLSATAIAALEADGVREPGRRLALIRGWKTGTLIIKNGDFTPGELTRIRAFCRERSFDLDWLPDLRPEEANRYNLLARPDFPEAMQALLGPGRARYQERYKYFIEPASDDRPYFFHFFKWSSLPEWLDLRKRGGMPLLEWGYPVLVATLIQATLAGLVLILLPLGLAGRRLPNAGRGRVIAYFSALGLAFMFVEIAFIQKFMLFLSHPLYAVAVVLCGFLLFAGLGSRMSGRLRGGQAGRGQPERRVRLAVAAIAGIALAYLFLLPELFRLLAGLPDAARIALSLGLIAPLAFFMGMPFPLGLQRLAGTAPAFLPWAWGINACVSVVAAVLATLVAMHLGFTAVVILALLGYLAAAWSFPAGLAPSPPAVGASQ